MRVGVGLARLGLRLRVAPLPPFFLPILSPLPCSPHRVLRLHVPLNASVVVFAVPCPLEGHRPDVSAVAGGIVRLDVSLSSPRRFHVLLPFDQVMIIVVLSLINECANGGDDHAPFFLLKPLPPDIYRNIF